MWWVVTDMYDAQARTALSPEWDRGFDEAFTDLISSDPDLVQAEFDALIGAGFNEPPTPPAPPAPPDGSSESAAPHPYPGPSAAPTRIAEHEPDAIGADPRPPP
jgi:hypothetical protein